MLTERRAV